MRIREITEVAVPRNDPEMLDYDTERSKDQQQTSDAPYYVEWSAQSWEWYGDDDPAEGNGRYKPKGDGGRIVAINVPTFAQAQQIADQLDADYEGGDFEDQNVYSNKGKGHYVLDYHGSNIRSMAKMDGFDKETIAMTHDNFKPTDYSETR